MIDYGAVVIKDGVIINENTFFMDMKSAVGWTDRERIRYEDCDFTRDNGSYIVSNCPECPRALIRVISDEYGSYKQFLSDCRGNTLNGNHIDGNYYAYVGDEHLTLAFYKTHVVFCVNKKSTFKVWGTRFDGRRHKSARFDFCGVSINIKHLGDSVYVMKFSYNGSHYTVVYGYGIDPNMRVWDKIKVEYLGKRLARDVDKVYARACYMKV